MDAQTKLEIEAAAFRRMQKHLMEDRTDVQNIDMMNQSGFAETACRAGIKRPRMSAGST